jgi:hypothetical protein
MPPKKSFFLTYKKAIITAVIGLLVVSAVPSTIYVHDAWGDERYVMKAQDLRDQINSIDHALFEIDQEISFADTDKDRAKWTARKNYYLREKRALEERLRTQGKSEG